MKSFPDRTAAPAEPLTEPRAKHDIEPSAEHDIEPWLRGPIQGVNPLIAPVLYTFQHAREDLAKWTGGLTQDELWATPHGFGSVGFHLRHLAGSTDRLLCYAQGRQLSAGQLTFLKMEHEPGATREELLAAMDAAFQRVEQWVKALDPAVYTEFRGIGRKQLPATVIGVLVHIAEHTQRHIGQAISASKLAKVLSGNA